MVKRWVEPSYAVSDRLSGRRPRADRAAAMAGATFPGRRNVFVGPVEAEPFFGVDTSADEVVEQFADSLVDWADYGTSADGQLTSALDGASTAPAFSTRIPLRSDRTTNKHCRQQSI